MTKSYFNVLSIHNLLSKSNYLFIWALLHIEILYTETKKKKNTYSCKMEFVWNLNRENSDRSIPRYYPDEYNLKYYAIKE